MAEVENRVLENIPTKPSLYCRYVDDIYVICEDDVLEQIKNDLETISGLSFTVEYSINNRLPFLNVLVEKVDGNLKTTVYRKPTDHGICLNASGESPNQYKISVIKGFLFRAKTLCTDKKDMLLEISRAKQILINNGYSNTVIDCKVKKFLNFENAPTNIPTKTTTHTVYYRNFMNTCYKAEEVAIKKIIQSGVTMKNPIDKINVLIYYKKRRQNNYL